MTLIEAIKKLQENPDGYICCGKCFIFSENLKKHQKERIIFLSQAISNDWEFIANKA